MAKPEENAEDWRSQVGERADPGALGIDLARARERNRGREATSPAEIPPLGWRDILIRMFWAISADRVLATAGSVAFFALLAVFPAVSTVISLYGLFADTSTVGTHLVLLSGLLPGGVLDLIADQILLITGKGTPTLGAAFLIGLVVSFWSANSGVAALFDALNVVYDEREERSLLRFYGTTFLFTLGAVGFIVTAIAGVVVTPIVLNFVGFASLSERLLALLRWPILLGVVVLGLAFLYRYGPSRRDPKWRWVTPGSVLAATLWVTASVLFSVYVANFDSYNKTYGSLGAVIGFMTWIWLSVVIVLLGAELNAEMEHQTAVDTTHGPPKPLGRRHAVMADHVGEAQS